MSIAGFAMAGLFGAPRAEMDVSVLPRIATEKTAAEQARTGEVDFTAELLFHGKLLVAGQSSARTSRARRRAPLPRRRTHEIDEAGGRKDCASNGTKPISQIFPYPNRWTSRACRTLAPLPL